MFIERYPKFEKDIILKAEMLENVKSYPRDMFHLIYQQHTDGIICGCQALVEEENQIAIMPGIIKRHGILYHLTKKEKLGTKPLGIEQILVVHFLDKEEHINDIVYPTEIQLKTDGLNQTNEIELCRFILKEGAVLRKDYQNFRDMSTLHNTVNLIQVPYAAMGQSTLSPEITYRFGKEMLQCKLSDPYDTAFVMLCMQQQVIQKEIIESYLQYRVDHVEKGSLTQHQLYQYLNVILDRVKGGENSGGRKNGGPRRMMVD